MKDDDVNKNSFDIRIMNMTNICETSQIRIEKEKISELMKKEYSRTSLKKYKKIAEKRDFNYFSNDYSKKISSRNWKIGSQFKNYPLKLI